MTTLAIMKARIADELMRDDLTSQIAYAITEAIENYQPHRFYFNESDGIEFRTLTSDTIPYLYDIDAVFLLKNGQYEELRQITPELWRVLSDAQTGEPYNWVYFQEEMRLYPTPDQQYTIKVQAHYKVSAPASDSEASNSWMTDAKSMIRHYSKALLWRDVIYDAEKAAICFLAAEQAFELLKNTTNKMNRSGFVKPTEF